VGVFFETSVPNVPANEYTVMLEHGTNPPDPYIDPRSGTGAILVVQNVYPFEEQPQLGQRVAVRVVGNSARIIANALPPEAAARLATASPMPIPLSGPGPGPYAYAADTVTYGGVGTTYGGHGTSSTVLRTSSWP
jgi:hypothetical protein